jgi:hypothetical protein
VEALFSKEIQAGLDAARLESIKRRSRLSVRAGDVTLPVLRLWKTGFSMEAEAPSLRGLVDLHEGHAHLLRCLIVTSEEDGGERRYEFKRATAVAHGPAADFEVAADAPAALIEDQRATGDR